MGDDTLRGSAGNDLLIGGAGNDPPVGGTGADVFGSNAPGWGYDQIFDFSRAAGDKTDMRGTGATSFGQLTLTLIDPAMAVRFSGSRFDIDNPAGLQASDFNLF